MRKARAAFVLAAWLVPVLAVAAPVRFRRLTPGVWYAISVSAGGTRVAFEGFGDPDGSNPDGSLEIFLWEEPGTVRSLTSWPERRGGSLMPSISSDGRRVAFCSFATDLVGQNPLGSDQIYLWGEGTGLRQLTEGGRHDFSCYYPVGITPGGEAVALYRPSGPALMLWSEAGGLEELEPVLMDYYAVYACEDARCVFHNGNSESANNVSSSASRWSLGSGSEKLVPPGGLSCPTSWCGIDLAWGSKDGSVALLRSEADLVPGTNPGGVRQLYRWYEGDLTVITPFAEQDVPNAAASEDGRRVVFVSKDDLVGENPERNEEVYLWEEGEGLTQLTHTTGTSEFMAPDLDDRGRRIFISSGYDLTLPGSPSANERALFMAVTGNEPPVPVAEPVAVECSGELTPVALDASGSWDPDGDPLTFEWRGAFPEGGGLVRGPTPTVSLPLGEHLVELTVSDGFDQATLPVAVSVMPCTPSSGDPTAPLITSLGPADGALLWPPNGRMVCFEEIASEVRAADPCAGPGPLRVVVADCSIEQGARDHRHGRRSGPDCVLTGPPGAATGVCARAEREGDERPARTYRVEVAVSDGCGNETRGALHICVPHDQGHGVPCGSVSRDGD